MKVKVYYKMPICEEIEIDDKYAALINEKEESYVGDIDKIMNELQSGVARKVGVCSSNVYAVENCENWRLIFED